MAPVVGNAHAAHSWSSEHPQNTTSSDTTAHQRLHPDGLRAGVVLSWRIKFFTAASTPPLGTPNTIGRPDPPGTVYCFCQLIGRDDLLLGEAVGDLRRAGLVTDGDSVEREIVGRTVLDGRWTFQIIEEFDDLYYEVARSKVDHSSKPSAASSVQAVRAG